MVCDTAPIILQRKNIISHPIKDRTAYLKHCKCLTKRHCNTIVLDTRSANRYTARHLKGAISLPFTDFTQANLARLIPDANTRILIYCNNNFMGDQINFATKTAAPSAANNHTPLTLALNIPTYINLYGYGYKNIYELDELVNMSDTRVQFEGTVK